LLDENVDVRIASFLKEEGFDTLLCPKGIQNGEVLALAKKEDRILLTNDKDFSNTDLYNPDNFHGIVVFRMHPPSYSNLKMVLEKLLTNFSPDEFARKLFIITHTGIQIE
jgi:predicted nuclease of predicted toxin-antitoxin system